MQLRIQDVINAVNIQDIIPFDVLEKNVTAPDKKPQKEEESTKYCDTTTLEDDIDEAKSSASSISNFFTEGVSKIIKTIVKAKEFCKNILTPERNVKNGKIEDSKQGNTGDCWLLSSVNALSYSDKGKQIIKNALEYDENGTTVHLKGVGDYYVSNDELQEAEKAKKLNSTLYTNGDDDMLVFELAVEKVRKDIVENGTLDFTKEALEEGRISCFLTDSVPMARNTMLDGGTADEALYYITGKKPEFEFLDISHKDKMIDDFIKDDNENLVMAANLSSDREIKDIDGNDIKLSGPHGYSVKAADKNSVTIVNPWDSTACISIPRETFVKHFGVTLADLSDETPKADNVLIKTTPQTVTDDGDFKVRNILDEKGNIVREDRIVKDAESFDYCIGRPEYDENGKLVSTVARSYYSPVEYNCTYDENGQFLKCGETFYEDGKRFFETVTNYQNGEIANIINVKYDDKESLSKTSAHYYHQGELICQETYTYTDDGIDIQKTIYNPEDGSVANVENRHIDK